MLRRTLFAAGVLFALVLSATATAQTSTRIRTHKLIVSVERTMAPSAEKKLAVLVLISQNDAAPAGALATPSKPLTVLQHDGGVYRIKAEIDSTCKGSCAAPSYRISGSANHTLEVVPNCRSSGPCFVCSSVRIVKVH